MKKQGQATLGNGSQSVVRKLCLQKRPLFSPHGNPSRELEPDPFSLEEVEAQRGQVTFLPSEGASDQGVSSRTGFKPKSDNKTASGSLLPCVKPDAQQVFLD